MTNEDENKTDDIPVSASNEDTNLESATPDTSAAGGSPVSEPVTLHKPESPSMSIDSSEPEPANSNPEPQDTMKSADTMQPGSKKTAFSVIAALLILITVLVIIVVLILSKPSKDNDSEDTLSKLSPTPQVTLDPTQTVSDDNVSDDVPPTPTVELIETGPATLGQYIGIEVQKISTEVTEEDLTLALEEFQNKHKERVPIENRDIVQDKDLLDINFEGFMDDKAFEGGSAENQILLIGSNGYIPGFEEGLIGAKVGEEVTLNLNFPDPYQPNPEDSGKPVVFKVTVNSINEEIAPELTDELIAENTDYKTIEEYKESIRVSLAESKATEAENKAQSDIIQALVDNATYPDDISTEIDSYNQIQKAQYDEMAYANAGVDAVTLFGSIYGMSPEEFEKNMLDAATNQIKLRKALEAVIKEEGITLTEEEYQKGIEDLVTTYGYESEEALLEINSQEDIEKSILVVKAQDFVIANAVINEAK